MEKEKGERKGEKREGLYEKENDARKKIRKIEKINKIGHEVFKSSQAEAG